MKLLQTSSMLAALCGLQLIGLTASMNPLEKTVELLTQLQGQVVGDGERAESAFRTYQNWCEETCAEKSVEVKGSTKQKAKLEADIQLASSDIEASTTKIEELGKEVSANEQKKTDLLDARKAEHETFEAAEKQLMETIDMLGRAIEVLEKEMQGNKAALVQATIDTDSLENVLMGLAAVIDAAGIPQKDTDKLAALLQARQDSRDGDDLAEPSAQAYDSHSQSIVEVMEDMRDKAEEQLRQSRESEANSKQNMKLIHQSILDQIKNLEKDMKDEKSDKAASEEAKATSEGDLSVTVNELKSSQDALKNTQDSCLRTAAEHETSVQGRKQELGVLAKAKKTIQASMLQMQAPSFVQVSSKSKAKVKMHSHAALISRQIVKMVKELAAQQKSSALTQLASRLNSVVRFGMTNGQDPFAKVKELILEMVKKLEGQLSSEAKEKEYCDNELKKTTEQHQELTDKIDGLRGKMDQAESKTAALKSDVKDLQQELAEIAKQQAELDKVRSVSREAFMATKADLQKSLDGTRTAIRMLREYYANDDSAASASLLQDDDSFAEDMKQPAAPEKFEKASGAGSSIIGILEVSESDLAKNLAEEEAEEAGKQTEYEKLTQEAKLVKVVKEKDVEYRTAEYKALDKSLTDTASDYDTESDELEAVQEYLAKVKERCIAKPETYEARKEKREAEIRGLRDALSILKSDTQGTLLQSSLRGRRLGQPVKEHS